jgi:hypothetical protein
MLINIRVSELISDTNNNIPLAIIAILAFFLPYNNLLPDSKVNTNDTGFKFETLKTDTQISYVSSNN